MLYLQAATPAFRVHRTVAPTSNNANCNPVPRRGAASQVAIQLTTAAAASWLLLANPTLATTITGMARAVDGDTLQVGTGNQHGWHASTCRTGGGNTLTAVRHGCTRKSAAVQISHRRRVPLRYVRNASMMLVCANLVTQASLLWTRSSRRWPRGLYAVWCATKTSMDALWPPASYPAATMRVIIW